MNKILFPSFETNLLSFFEKVMLKTIVDLSVIFVPYFADLKTLLFKTKKLKIKKN